MTLAVLAAAFRFTWRQESVPRMRRSSRRAGSPLRRCPFLTRRAEGGDATGVRLFSPTEEAVWIRRTGVKRKVGSTVSRRRSRPFLPGARAGTGRLSRASSRSFTMICVVSLTAGCNPSARTLRSTRPPWCTRPTWLWWTRRQRPGTTGRISSLSPRESSVMC